MELHEAEKLLESLIERFEYEVVEFKEANNDYDFDKIGQYFSAISNEANLRMHRYGWLVFGVTNKRVICGTNYRTAGSRRSLQDVKKEIADWTPNRITFFEIYELFVGDNQKRVIMFQIPAAAQGAPTSWKGHFYGRDHESLVALSIEKQDEIRNQGGQDWSKNIIPTATINHLEPNAIAAARQQFYKKNENKTDLIREAQRWSDGTFLDKVGLTIEGRITNTALLLLGKQESEHFFEGFIPTITWSLYGADGMSRSYEHFHIPFVLAVDEAYKKIRNLRYQYMSGQTTLFPDTVDMYDPWLIRELLHNCIAHQDYRIRGRINLQEYEDRLVFINEGSFIPGTIEVVLEPSYTPPTYRNPFLANAMTNINMIDTLASGIQRVYRIQISRYFPMPDYDLSNPRRVKVTVNGQIIDGNYTKLLYSDSSLDLQTVFLLDRVQKKLPVAKADILFLRKRGLVEGRAPNIYVSGKIAKLTGAKAQYIRNRSQKDDYYMQKILEYIDEYGGASFAELRDLLVDMMPEILDDNQKVNKIHNLMTKLRKQGTIAAVSKGNGTRKDHWVRC